MFTSPNYLTTLVLGTILIYVGFAFYAHFITSAEASTTLKNIFFLAPAHFLLLFISNSLEIRQATKNQDLTALIGCYEQRVSSDNPRQVSHIRITLADGEFTLSGVAMDKDGRVAAQWFGRLTDIHPSDNIVQWHAVASIYQEAAVLRGRNAGEFHMGSLNSEVFTPAGEFTDIFPDHSQTYTFEMRKVESCGIGAAEFSQSQVA